MEAIAAVRIVLDEFKRWGVLTDDVLVGLVKRRGVPARFWRRIRIQLSREGRLESYGSHTFRNRRGKNQHGWKIPPAPKQHGRTTSPHPPGRDG